MRYNTGENVDDLGNSDRFLHKTSKTWSIKKKKKINWTTLKLKITSVLQNTMLKE